MEWIGGTDEAKKLINELIKSGDLINYYSYDWFNSLDRTSHRSKNHLDEIINFQGTDCLNHLLIGCFHDNDDRVMKLLNLSSAFRKNYQTDFICDCFAFINLYTQSILYMGIAPNKRHYQEILITHNGTLADDFEELDYHRIIYEFRESVKENLADSMNKIYFNGDSSEYYSNLILGKNGLYHDEHDVDEIEEDSEDGMTKEELDRHIKFAEDNEQIIEEELIYLRMYFPKFSTDYIFE